MSVSYGQVWQLFQTSGDIPSARCGSIIAPLNPGEVIIFGGKDSKKDLTDIYSYATATGNFTKLSDSGFRNHKCYDNRLGNYISDNEVIVVAQSRKDRKVKLIKYNKGDDEVTFLFDL